MRLPFFQPKEASNSPGGPAQRRRATAAAAATDDAGALDAARVHARRRLIGAVVLLVAGVIGFPLLFETQPRPLPIDTRIDASRADTGNPRVASGAVVAPPPVLPPTVVTEGPAAVMAAAPPAAGAAPAVTTPAATLGAPAVLAPPVAAVPPVLWPAPAASVPAAAPATRPPSAGETKEPKPASPAGAVKPNPAGNTVPPAKVEAKPVPPGKASVNPAPALGSASEAAGSEAGVERYVVQVGAFNDNTRMREARTKVERIGYKTYTSEVDSPSGPRTRVRLGPFPTKAEAEAAAVKVKTTGLPANVLKL